MRKVLLCLLLFLPLVGNAGEPDDIPLQKEVKTTSDDQRDETGLVSFTAQIISNNFIKVQSSDISTFEVSILKAENNTICYEGSTINGILHITTSSLSAGNYILIIKGDGFKYVGAFLIAD